MKSPFLAILLVINTISYANDEFIQEAMNYQIETHAYETYAEARNGIQLLINFMMESEMVYMCYVEDKDENTFYVYYSMDAGEKLQKVEVSYFEQKV